MKAKKYYHFSFTPQYFLRMEDKELQRLWPNMDIGEIKMELTQLAEKKELVPIEGCDNFDPHEGCMGHIEKIKSLLVDTEK